MDIPDPRKIPQTDFPLFIFANNSVDLTSFIVTWRTKGTWNHAMLARTQGLFVSQAWTYAEFDMARYMKPGVRLRFFTLKNADQTTVTAINGYIAARLKAPWFHKLYDWIGIFGQAIGLPAIHTPGLEYCSVDVVKALKTIAWTLPEIDQNIIAGIPDESHPQQVHDVMWSFPQTFVMYGGYEGDEGVVVK